jgi:hypothetical protein
MANTPRPGLFDNILGGHNRLTIGCFAPHSTVLTRNAHGFSSLLEETGIIEREPPALGTDGKQVLDPELVQSQRIPVGIGKPMLQTFR